MNLGLEGKQVVITGGSKGIGLAVAHAFAAEGAGIVIASRTQAMLEQAAGEIRRKHNAKVTAHPADLSLAAERTRLHRAFPDADILVNNAGAIPSGGIADITWSAGSRPGNSRCSATSICASSSSPP